MNRNSWFVSIDTETLGLSHNAPVIELGAVIADWTGAKQSPGAFHAYVLPEYGGYDNCEPYAMSMHPEILRRIAERNEAAYTFLHPEDVAEKFAEWLNDFPDIFDKGKITIAGKNFASFDLPKLNLQFGFDHEVKYHHRFLDPGMLFWDPFKDDRVPDTDTCLERAGIEKRTVHNAVGDAQLVVELIQAGVRRISAGTNVTLTPQAIAPAGSYPKEAV